MNAQEAAGALEGHSAAALQELVRIIDDPNAKARDRLTASRTLKGCLLSLTRLAEAQQTSPYLRRQITDVLRNYRRTQLVDPQISLEDPPVGLCPNVE